MKKIAIVTPELVGLYKNGGIGTNYFFRARFLSSCLNHEVTILYTGDCSQSAVRKWREQHGQTGIRLEVLPGMLAGTNWELFQRRAMAVHQWLAAEAWDEIHFPEYLANGLVCLQAKRAGLAYQSTRLVVSMHSSSVWLREGMQQWSLDPVTDARLDYAEQYCCENADALVCPSRFLLGWAERKGWRLPPNRVLLPHLYELLSGDNLPSGWHNPRHLIFFGRLQTLKGLGVFCEAVERLVNVGLAPERVDFLGKVGTHDGLPADKYIRQMSLHWPETETQIYADLDNFAAMQHIRHTGGLAVIASLRDNLPYTVIECIINQVPFVASDSGGIPELADARVLFAPDARSLAAKLAEFSRLPPEAKFNHPYQVETARQAWKKFMDTPVAMAASSAVLPPLPKISICVPFYNHGRYLPDALASLARQPYENFEIIVVDDGSTDASSTEQFDRVQKEYLPPRYRFFKQQNGGVGAARNFAVAQDSSGGKVRVRGFLHSDRGLYRPGDTVHLKGLVRLLESSGKMAVPTKKRRIHLVVTDPRNKAVVDENLAISDFGGFHKDVKVTDEAALGDFQVRAEIEGQSFADHFSVEEYRPRTFEVKLGTAKRDLLLGQPLRFDVKANFLYGSPLRGGKLTYQVRRRQHLAEFTGFGDYVFQDYASQYDVGHYWARYEERSFSELVSDGEVALDRNGATRVTVRDKDKLKVPQDYVLEATVTDETGESVSAGRMVVGHTSELYLGLHPSEFVQAVDMPFGIQVVGFDKEGNRRAATAELELIPRRYACGAHGSEGYWSCQVVPAKGPAIKRTITVPASGSAAVERVVLKEPGEYVVRIFADGKGEKAIASDVIWVIGKGDAFWSGDEGDRMTVIASKASYAPGDTARLVPQTRMPGALALTTLERDGIMGYALTPLATSGQPVEVKVTPEMAPNVFVSVTMVRGRTGEGDRERPRFKMGLVDLKVESTVQRLNVAVTTERPSYQPGDEVKATVRVTAASGQPVRAELALAAADEGVLQIVGFKTPDPMAAFYAPFALGVESATTWNRLLRKIDPNHDDGEEGGDGADDEAGRIRSRFMATAFWAPALVTDDEGRVQVTFKAPDNLTAFRMMAMAADQGSRFGSGEQRFTVAKPLQAIPALPRFLSPGDHVQAAVAIHNNTDQKQEVDVRAAIEGVTVHGGSTRKVTLAAHAFRRLTFDVTAKREGEAKFVFRAEARGLKDAVAVRVPVRRASVLETLMVGEDSTHDRAKHELPALGATIPGRGSLEISLDRSGLGRLDEGLAYLVGYPYGCLEQTTSKVVPMIAISELAKNVRLPGLDAGQARKFVELGIAKILRH